MVNIINPMGCVKYILDKKKRTLLDRELGFNIKLHHAREYQIVKENVLKKFRFKNKVFRGNPPIW